MNKVQTEDSICLYSLASEAQQLESVHIKFSTAYSIQIATIITNYDGERRTLIPITQKALSKRLCKFSHLFSNSSNMYK